MIDLNEIEDEISRLEHGKTTYSSCEKLSVLYTVRNQLRDGADPEKIEHDYPRYSYAPAPTTEFLQMVSEANYMDVLTILDEHMTTLQVVYPKEYQKIIDKIKMI